MAANRSPIVLIVDDDITTNSIIESILRRAGFQTKSAFSVAEAISAMQERSPDIAILDISLPDGNGV